MGVTSFHAQFTYIFATKRQWAPPLLEALGLDAGAVIFSLLGIALARLGRRAAVERVLVVTCALGSCGMNVLNANMAPRGPSRSTRCRRSSSRSASDRLIAVIRRAALGQAADDDAQRSAWYIAGRSRSTACASQSTGAERHGHAAGHPERHAAHRGTAAACRRADAATSIPDGYPRAASKPAARARHTAARRAARPIGRTCQHGARDRHVPAKGGHQDRSIPGAGAGPARTSGEPRRCPTSTGSAPNSRRGRLHAGSARNALRAAVLAAQDGAS